MAASDVIVTKFGSMSYREFRDFRALDIGMTHEDVMTPDRFRWATGREPVVQEQTESSEARCE